MHAQYFQNGDVCFFLWIYEMEQFNIVMITMPGARWSARIVELASVLRQQLIKCLAFKRTQHSD